MEVHACVHAHDRKPSPLPGAAGLLHAYHESALDSFSLTPSPHSRLSEGCIRGLLIIAPLFGIALLHVLRSLVPCSHRCSVTPGKRASIHALHNSLEKAHARTEVEWKLAPAAHAPFLELRGCVAPLPLLLLWNAGPIEGSADCCLASEHNVDQLSPQDYASTKLLTVTTSSVSGHAAQQQ